MRLFPESSYSSDDVQNMGKFDPSENQKSFGSCEQAPVMTLSLWSTPLGIHTWNLKLFDKNGLGIGTLFELDFEHFIFFEFSKKI
jgi:hypothetical protein